MPVTDAPMWKCTGSFRPAQVSQNGSHSRLARSGAPRSCGSDVLPTQADRAGEDHLLVDAALVEDVEAYLRVIGADVDLLVLPLEQRLLCLFLRAVDADHPTGAVAAHGVAVEDPHPLPVDQLDVRDTVLVLRRREGGEEVLGLGEVTVCVDDELLPEI